jgi:hypothetical protein
MTEDKGSLLIYSTVMPDFLEAASITYLLKRFIIYWLALLVISVVNILKNPSEHPVKMSPFSSKLIDQMEEGSWTV